MKTFLRACALFFLLPLSISAAPLKSPWDGTAIAPADTPYTCPNPISMSRDITLADRHILDKPGAASLETRVNVYGESTAALRDTAQHLVIAADAYWQSGNINAARCVATLLSAAAADHAWTGWISSRPAFLDQTIGLRVSSIAYLKVAGSGALEPAQKVLIQNWLEQLAQEQRRAYSSGDCGHRPACFNHAALGGAQAVAVSAIVRNDKSDFGWALGKYKDALHMLDNHGILPQDIHGRWTLKFQLEAAAALTQIAEYAEVNGNHLYDYNRGALHVFVRVATRAILNPAPYTKSSRAQQEVRASVEGWEIAWATVYQRRFPDPVILSLLEQSDTKGLYEWGGVPLS